MVTKVIKIKSKTCNEMKTSKNELIKGICKDLLERACVIYDNFELSQHVIFVDVVKDYFEEKFNLEVDDVK